MAEEVRCPVFQSALTYEKALDALRRIEHYPCPKCGEYVITMEAKAALPYLLKRPGAAALVSHFIRKMPRTGQEETPDDLPLVKQEHLETILKHGNLPDPTEQAINMVLWLGDNTTSGQYVPSPRSLGDVPSATTGPSVLTCAGSTRSTDSQD